MQKVLMRWQASSFFGWGVLGLNIFERWTVGPDIQALMGCPITPRDFAGIDPLRYSVLQPAITASNQFLEAVTAGKTNLREQGGVVIDGFGDNFAPIVERRRDDHGVRNIARCIFETTRIDNTQAVAAYDSLV